MSEFQLWNSTLPDRLMLTFVHYLWQGILVAVVAAICGTLLERVSSRIRYGFFLSSFVVLTTCPVLTFVFMETPTASPLASKSTRTSPESSAHSAVAAFEVTATTLGEVDVPSGVADVTTEQSGDVSSEGDRASLAELLSAYGRHWRWIMPYATIAYLCGVVILLGRLVVGLHGGWRLQQISRPVVDRDWLALIDRQVEALKLNCTPAVLLCKEVAVPTVIGLLRPTILLPLSFTTGLPMDQVEAVLTHELGHIRRWDHAVNVFQRVAEALLFFHPAVWWISHRIRVERELCCDDLVIRLGTVPETYVRSLLDVAELGLRQRRSASVAAVATLQATGSGRQSQIATRVRRLLGIRQRSQVRLTPAGTASVLAAILLTIGAPLVLGVVTSADAQLATEGEAKALSDKAISTHEIVVIDSATGKPIRDAQVTIQRVIRSDRGSAEKYLGRTHHKSDASGKLTFQTTEDVRQYIDVFVDHRDYATFNAPLSLGVNRIELSPADHVSGSFVSTEGRPVPGVQLLAVSATSRTGRSSYYRATSEDDGTFAVNVVKGGTSVLYILPEKHAAKLVVSTGRLDLGKIELNDGVAVSGYVLDVRGKPVANAWVNASNRLLMEKASEEVMIVPQFTRSAKTDQDGRFTMAPLAANEYEMRVERTYSNLKGVVDRKYEVAAQLPAVFARTDVKIEQGVVPQPLRLQAVPHVQVTASFVDNDGNPASPVTMDVGHINYTDFWEGDLSKGTAKCLIPHGVDAVLHFRLPQDESIRYRLSKDSELKNVAGNGSVPIGSVTDDISDLEVVRYKAPTIHVRVVDEDGNQVPGDVIVSGTYPSGTQPIYVSTAPQVKSDVRFRKTLSNSFRSGGLLPDEELIIHARAAGYETGSKTIRLPEGKEENLRIVLKRQS